MGWVAGLLSAIPERIRNFLSPSHSIIAFNQQEAVIFIVYSNILCAGLAGVRIMFFKTGWFTGLCLFFLVFSSTFAGQPESLWLFPFSAANGDTTQINLNQEIPNRLAQEFENLKQYRVLRKTTPFQRFSRMTQNVPGCTNGQPTTDALAVSGNWVSLGRSIHLNTQVSDVASGVLIAEYESRLQNEDFLADLQVEAASLAQRIHQDLIERKSPFGFPFHANDYGILYCDFRTSLNQSENDHLWRELTDSLATHIRREGLRQIKFKRICRQIIDSLLVSPSGQQNLAVARRLGSELNARMVLWSEAGANQSIRFNFANLDTLFELPAIQEAQLPPFAIARDLGVVEFPETSWSNRQNLLSFVSALLLFQQQKYQPAFGRWQQLAQQVWPDWFPVHFYAGNAALLNATSRRAADGALKPAAEYYHASLRLSDSVPHLTTMVYNNLGVFSQLQGEPNAALDWFKKAVAVAQRDDLKLARIRAYHNLANVFLIKREWKSAEKTYRAGLSLVDTATNQRAAAILLDNLGILNQRLKNYDAAIQNFQQSLALKQQTHSPEEIAQTGYYLGSAYQSKNELDRALEYYLLSLDENLKIKNELQIARMYAHIGKLHWLKGELNMALEYYLKRAELTQYLGDESKQLETDLIIAEIHQKNGELVAALDYLTRAQALTDVLEDNPTKAHVLDKAGEILNTQSRYPEALSVFEEAVNLFEKTGQIERLTLTMFNMGLIQVKLKNYQAGYDLMQAALEKEEAAGFSNLKKEKPFMRQLATIIEELKP
jgi:tetratricopeptide (TPR) repeat protein